MKARQTPPKVTVQQETDDCSNDEPGPIRVKVISLGDVQVGKSCLIKKYCEPTRFVSNYIPTIGVDYGVKATSNKMNDGRKLQIKIDFFDLSGDFVFFSFSAST